MLITRINKVITEGNDSGLLNKLCLREIGESRVFLAASLDLLDL